VAGGIVGFGGSEPPVVDIDIRIRSNSRRESPVHSGMMGGSSGLSPLSFQKKSQPFGEDYIFHSKRTKSLRFRISMLTSHKVADVSEAQQSDLNFKSLERNSYNFLEYELHFSALGYFADHI
jgi:hypothetical protein